MCSCNVIWYDPAWTHHFWPVTKQQNNMQSSYLGRCIPCPHNLSGIALCIVLKALLKHNSELMITNQNFFLVVVAAVLMAVWWQ